LTDRKNPPKFKKLTNRKDCMDLESLIDEQTFADSQDNNSRRSNSGSYSSSSGAIRSDRNQNELFTWRVKAGANRVYYLNIKTDKNGNHYLVIKETKHADDGSKRCSSGDDF
jgi:hypothetical protein